MARFLILGCGWVGEAFALLAVARGQEITVTVTSEEKAQRLRDQGVEALVHNFDQSAALALEEQHFDYVLNSIPASKKNEILFVKNRFQNVAKLLGNLAYQKHIYLSSIGIYPEQSQSFDESFSDEAQMSDILLLAEKIVGPLPNTIVYRLGGLFGQQRIFAKYFQDKVCQSGEQSANFIHLDDVVQLLWLGFTQPLSQPVYNVVCLHHPKKEAVIRASAAKYGYGLPSAFADGASYDKVVSGDQIVRELNYSFVYPSPLDF
ncbi:NAD-binding protein [Sphingobacterium sp. lm-10]|uniref:saccharopine dehydrogenase NADP-binding domain-containing protein n=1 Tax=Sphingobacterium sp. lm-10 TaxID=2944904 RepID=UPI0020219316|nr:saccharopine dehydrogenase NADP-binding domain-containing protein [Sphingobacterium sp. lm-10]MCL7989112.1 NAD-binding protein [Sphingobacterium sp. lm-10]